MARTVPSARKLAASSNAPKTGRDALKSDSLTSGTVAIRNPAIPLAAQRMAVSVRSWRISLPRVAPSATRIRTSWRRPAAKPRRRLATLAQAMSSTNRTMSISTPEINAAVERESGGSTLIFVTTATRSLSSCGNADANCPDSAWSSARACCCVAFRWSLATKSRLSLGAICQRARDPERYPPQWPA